MFTNRVSCIEMTGPEGALGEASGDPLASRTGDGAKNGSGPSPARSIRNLAFRPRSRQQSVDRRNKKVRFYRNGDHYFSGLDVTIVPERHRSLTMLLQELSRILDDKLFLINGVRYIFTLDGTIVQSLEELSEDQAYVCSSVEVLKKLDYLAIKCRPLFSAANNSNNVNSDAMKRRSLAEPSRSSRSSAKQPVSNNVITPKRISVLLNGPKPRQVMRLLLDDRSAQSFMHVLDRITETFSPLPGPIRKVFDIQLGECQNLADFFHGEVFIASVSGKVARCDLELDAEEQKLTRKRIVGRNSSSSRQFPTNGGTYVCTARDYVACSPRVSRRMTLPKQNAYEGSSYNIHHPPDIRDRYNIGKLIGNGNFATVHECVEWRTGRQAAIKIIEKNKIRDKRLIGNEMIILRRLRHPNIVNLLDEYTFAGRLYVVMELVKGGDLFTLISQATKFSEPHAADLLRCLCQALDYLHTNRVVHRDVKPENLLVFDHVDGTRCLKLADFGLASQVKDGEPLLTICGSPTYVAPEILAETGYGFKVDIWATGVTLFILLCGFPPFQSNVNDQEALFEQILTGQFEFRAPFWDDVSAAGKDLIRKMIQVQVEQRYFAHQILEHEWMKTYSRLKTIRETSVADSSSSDSGIQLKQQFFTKGSAKHLAAAVASEIPVIDTVVASEGFEKPLPRLYKKFSSSSVADLPAEFSPGFWGDF